MRLYNIVLFLLLTSVFTGSALYIGIQKLQLFRLIILFSVFLSLYLLYASRITIRYNFKLYLIWFFIYYLWTIFISFSVDIDLNNYINFSILLILNLVLIIFINFDILKFLNILTKALYFMFFVMLSVAIWEVITHHHLNVATFFNKAPEYIQFQPATFYTNPNDFMAMLTLLVIYIFGYKKTFNRKIAMYDYFLLLIALILSFITNSRIVMMVLLLTFIVVSLNKSNIKYLFIVIVILITTFVYNVPRKRH